MDKLKWFFIKGKMAKYLVSFFTVWLLTMPFAVNGQVRLLFTQEVDIKYAITDKLQQIYIVTPDDVVIKYDDRGREMGRYTNNYLGELEMVDPTNPINVVLYYPDQQTLVTLDVTMNEIARTNLVSFGFFNIEALCSTNDGNLWILDGMEFKLKKIDRNGRILYRSQNLMILMGEPFKPIKLLERNNQVFALDPTKGIFVFDNMGSFDRRYDIRDVDYFQFFGGNLYYFDRGRPMELSISRFLNREIKLPTEMLDDILYFNIQLERCYIFRQIGFEVWRY